MSGPRVLREQVDRAARLARLHLEDDEAEALASDLSSILAHVARLPPVEEGGPGFAAPAPRPLRDDEPRRSLRRDDALAAAPRTRAGQFVVPRVIP